MSNIFSQTPVKTKIYLDKKCVFYVNEPVTKLFLTNTHTSFFS